MIDLATQPCCVCAHQRSELLWMTSWPEHRYPGRFSMRRCLSCGLLFNSPRLDDAALAELYGRNYYFFSRPDAAELTRVVPMYQRTVALVADHIPQKRSIDIGCGRGYLPAVLKRLGWDARGVEISPDAADYARSRFGIDVFTGTGEQYAASESAARFPLVTAIDVIEHVPDPRRFVRAVAQLTESGGIVILDTPNAAADNISRRSLQWSGFNPFHIYLFTIVNLTALLESEGLRVQRAFSYNNSPSSGGARDTVARALKTAGLMGIAARTYFALKSISARNGAVEPHLSGAVELIRSTPAWDQSADATAPLSATNTGDNIVVIARRR